MVKQSVDAVVIGAGVIGCSIALELARGGRDVIVIDKSGGIGHGSTSASSGIVRFHYSTHAGVALAWEAAHGWQDWAGHLGASDPAGLATLRRTGMLVLDHVPGSSDAHHRAARRGRRPVGALGQRHDRPPHPAAGRRNDSVRPSRSTPRRSSPTRTAPSPAASRPTPGYVGDPQLATQNLGDAAERHRRETPAPQGGPGDRGRRAAALAAHDDRRRRARGRRRGECRRSVVVPHQRDRGHRARLHRHVATDATGGPRGHRTRWASTTATAIRASRSPTPTSASTSARRATAES